MENLIIKGRSIQATELVLKAGQAPVFLTPQGDVKASDQVLTNQALVQLLRTIFPDKIQNIQKGELVSGPFSFPQGGKTEVEAVYREKIVLIRFKLSYETVEEPPAPSPSSPSVQPTTNNPPKDLEVFGGRVPEEIMLNKDKFSLVVSKEASVVKTAFECITLLGSKPFEVKEGNQFHAILERYVPDFIIFDESLSDFNFIFKRMYDLSTEIRLKTCLVFISDRFVTEDGKAAFSHSVDLVCHPKDIDKLESMTKKVIERRQELFGALLTSKGR